MKRALLFVPLLLAVGGLGLVLHEMISIPVAEATAIGGGKPGAAGARGATGPTGPAWTTSAEARAAITDETGTGGAMVFATAPAITTMTASALGSTPAISASAVGLSAQAIVGTSANGAGLYGVVGSGSGSQGSGVSGSASSGNGVVGSCTTGIGVFGSASGAGTAVNADVTSATGAGIAIRVRLTDNSPTQAPIQIEAIDTDPAACVVGDIALCGGSAGCGGAVALRCCTAANTWGNCN